MAQPGAYRDAMPPLRRQPAAQIRLLPRPADLPLRSGPLHFVPGIERPHQPEQLKAQAVAMYAEGSSMNASSRPPGIPEARKEPSIPVIKKVGQARELLKLLREQWRKRPPGQPRLRVISFPPPDALVPGRKFR